MPESELLSSFIEEVQSSTKYAMLDHGLVERIAFEELHNQPNKSKALKSTRTRLHRIAGAFIPSRIDYAKWLGILKGYPSISSQEHLDSLKQIMRLHASTNERLPYLDTVYKDIFALFSLPKSILDLACGLNPLAIPWIPIDEYCNYHACDIVLPMINFLADYFKVFRSNTRVFTANILDELPKDRYDLIILLKTLPLLAQIDKAAPDKLLEKLNFKHLLISYPLKSLGKHHKGMEKTYRAQFEALIAGKPYNIQEYAIPNELFFLLSHHD